MNNRGKGTIFTNPNKLYEMLSLRKEGWSFTKLAEKYGCDHTSILYQVRKYHAVIPKDTKIVRINYGQSLKLRTKFTPVDELGEPVREIKDYAFYENRDRKERKELNEKYIDKRLAEENKKSSFCDDESKVLIRVML